MINSLRQNSLEVLVSPRVRTIPRSYRVTVLTHLFIIGVSLAAAMTYTVLSASTACQARPLGPDLNRDDFKCEGLKVRREFVGQLTLSNTTLALDLFFQQSVELQLEIVAPQFISTEFDELAVDPEIMGTLSNIFLTIMGVSPLLGLPVDNPYPSLFTERVLAGTQSVPGLEVRIVPQGVFPETDLSLFTSNQPAALPPNNPGLNITTDDYTLLMAFQTEGRLNCVLTMDFESDSAETQLVSACFSTATVGGGLPAIRFSYVGQKTVDAIQAAEAAAMYFQNMHGELFNEDEGAFGLMENLFATNFFFCCFPDNLDEVEYFGIFSGLGFLLEGIFTFLFVFVLFRGKISAAEAKKAAFKRHSFAYSVREGIIEEVDLKEAIKEDVELEKRSVRSVQRRDIIRVLFNPRCRYIPYASIVSFLSLAVLMGVSAVLAIWYQNLRTVEVCEPTPVNDLSPTTPNCESLTVANVFYERVTIGGNAISLQLTAQLFVDEGEVTSLSDDVDNIFNQDIVDAFSACGGEEYTACIADAGSQIRALVPTAVVQNITNIETDVREVNFFVNNFVPLPEGVDTFLDVLISARQGVSPGALGNATSTGFKEFELRWNYKRSEVPGPPTFTPKTLLEYSGSFRTNFIGQERGLDPFTDGGDISKGVIEAVGSFGGASNLIVKPVGSTFVQCCGLSSLEFYDYLGLMMGYVALFEGILTFLCAFILYELVRGFFKFKCKCCGDDDK